MSTNILEILFHENYPLSYGPENIVENVIFCFAWISSKIRGVVVTICLIWGDVCTDLYAF